jgi:hypothetical protein
MTQVIVENINPNISELENIWKDIYAKSTPNFFLSWHWIATWYKRLPTKPQILVAKIDNQCAGVCIVLNKKVKRFGLIKSLQLYLHKTGDEKLDQAWIEYNDFLVVDEHSEAIKYAFVKYITEIMHWDELIIGASDSKTFTPLLLNDLEKRDIWKSLSYKTDLEYIRENKLEYINTLSKNTRYQINRSLRIYQSWGGIELRFAASADEAVQWFEDAGPLHIQRWYKTKVGSGYSNPEFVAFHKALISEAFDSGNIHLIKIVAGDKVVCYLYNFIDGKEVKFYLAATNFNNSDKNLKPGLITHYLAINHYIKAGYSTYDFMAGESQYKRSLSSKVSEVSVSAFKQKNLRSKFESILRKIKHDMIDKRHLTENKGLYKFIICGGKESTQKGRNYDNAVAISFEVQDGNVKLTHKCEYQTPQASISPKTDITFKASSIHEGALIAVTETEVVELSLSDLTISKVISHPSFNDLHHAIKDGDSYVVANTGLDSVSIYTPSENNIKHISTINGQKISRLNQNSDYRRVASTKPHFIHPNYLFKLNNELWVTRCDTMDAVSLNSSKRIDIGSNLVHDGVIFKNSIYFTCVDGQIRIFDTQSLMLKHAVDLKEFVSDLNGWCRGILPISTNLAVVGISKFRSSKRTVLNTNRSYARLLLIDLFNREVMWDLNISDLGIDAIFGIHLGS